MRHEASEQATLIQREAADPDLSVVMSAAAGSGKTRVLVDRFVRLCLAGADPKSILAVTFTKKAAVEIKGRLLARARGYARADRQALIGQLTELLGREPDAGELRGAAGLYEHVLEDLAGLHVGTIHSFCQFVLGRFAADVGLDPHFTVLERNDELWAEALERLNGEVAADPELRACYGRLANNPSAVRRRLDALLADRVYLQRWLDRVRHGQSSSTDVLRGGDAAWWPRLVDDLRDRLFTGTALAEHEAPRVADCCADVADALDTLAGPGLAAVAAIEGENPTAGFNKRYDLLLAAAGRLARRLREVEADDDESARELLAEVGELLLTRDRGKLRSFTGRKKTNDERQRAFAAAAAPVLEVWLLAELVECYRSNRRLLRIGLRALDVYAGLKRRDGCLDFHDLEYLARRLLCDTELGPYVQYRLDERIDHLLLDEFQDTNFNQWEIVEPLVSEFLAGQHERQRSVFFVGDVKQSIYGFRGAEPGIFDQVRRLLASRDDARLLTLPTNFRSASTVVRALGDLFNAEPLASAITLAEAPGTRQQIARDRTRGSVTIVPAFVASGEHGSGDRQAARAAVGIVQRLVDGRHDGHRWAYREILILCRSRTHIGVYEQALRDAGIPLVPAGRGQLARSREVRDILALLRWLSYPDDHTALAAVLRSPLLRLSEQTLQQTLGRRFAGGAAGASRTLWATVREQDAPADLATAMQRLSGWRRRVGRESCHDLLRRIYREGQVLERFTAALGEQARYNLLRLHDLALGGESGVVVSLRRFAEQIEWAARTGGEEEASIPGRSGSGRVRLLTIHGAKGLEAPVVVLVDADARIPEHRRRLVLGSVGAGSPLLYDPGRLLLAGPQMPDGSRLGTLAAAAARAEAGRQQEEANLIYVALSRAREHLFVVGGRPERTLRQPSVLDQLQKAAGNQATDDSTTESRGAAPVVPSGLQVAVPEWLAQYVFHPDALVPTVAASSGPSVAATAAGVSRQWTPPPLGERIALIRPSAGAEIETAAESVAQATAAAERDTRTEHDAPVARELREQARQRGEAIHRWLQWAADAGVMPEGEGSAWEEAAAVFRDQRWRWLFFPEAEGGSGYSEVPVIARLLEAGTASPASPTPERRVVGIIDRLVLRPGRVDIVDYKSNRVADRGDTIDELVAAYRPQMQAYARVMRQLHPERSVFAHLLFTFPRPAGGRGRLATVRLED